MRLGWFGSRDRASYLHWNGASRCRRRIVEAMTRNQRSIGGLTAYLSCRCSKEAPSFDRGYLRLEESKMIGMWRGSRNSQVWSNPTCFNYADPSDNHRYGYLWNDSRGNQKTCWAINVGYLDVNAALAAVAQASDSEIAFDDEVVNGVACFKLAWLGNRLWVDENSSARVLRWESDYSDGTGPLLRGIRRLDDDRCSSVADETQFRAVL